MDQNNQPTNPQAEEPQPETWIPEVIDQPETSPAQTAQDDFVVVDIEPEMPGEPLQPEIVSGPSQTFRPASAPPPPQRNNSGTIITLIVVLVLLCCCCLATFAVLWFVGDLLIGIFSGIVQFVVDLLNSIFGGGFIQIN